MTRTRQRALGVTFVAALALGLVATAHGDDRATAEAILSPLEHDLAHQAVTASAIKEARTALERATRMRDANDEPHARLAEGLARQWAQVARDLVRAADAEKAATEARVGADDAGAHAERERALLEEAIARQGRLRAETEALQSKQGPDRTSATGASLDGGASQATKARPSPGAARGGARVPEAGVSGAEAGVLP